MANKLKRGSELELEIEALAFGGRGVARYDGLVVFVENALPRQRVRARIVRTRKDYCEARVLEVLKASSQEVEPRCPHFGECGGCRFQNLDYPAQLEYKHQQVVEVLQRLGGLPDPVVRPPRPSPELYYYRNKMEFSFGRERWVTRVEAESGNLTRPKDFALGLHVRGRFDKILDLDTCYLQSPLSAELLNLVRERVRQGKGVPYSTRDHAGFWRHLVIREGKNTGEVMVNLVTSDDRAFFDEVDALSADIQHAFPGVTTVVHNINRRKAQVATGEEERVLFGPGYIRERLGERLFRISANSFFQTNTKGAEILYNQVIEYGAFSGEEVVYDLYCGAGAIALYVADRVRQVVGFELVEDAVRDAHVNCELNDVQNCAFVAGDLKHTLAVACESWPRPDCVILDPPRAGLHPSVLQQVQRLQPRRIVYVSCNPATFARDVKGLGASGYVLHSVQPVDMFPHTAHIEVVGLLQLQAG